MMMLTAARCKDMLYSPHLSAGSAWWYNTAVAQGASLSASGASNGRILPKCHAKAGLLSQMCRCLGHDSLKSKLHGQHTRSSLTCLMDGTAWTGISIEAGHTGHLHCHGLLQVDGAKKGFVLSAVEGNDVDVCPADIGRHWDDLHNIRGNRHLLRMLTNEC